MTDRGSRMWESRLYGSERGLEGNGGMDAIVWHHREPRWQTEKTNLIM